MHTALLFILLYVAVAILPVVVASLTAAEAGTFLQEVGMSFALLGFGLLFLQVLLGARIKWIERAFGLDILIRYHKHMGVFAALLMLSHPLLLAAGGMGWHLILGVDLPWIVLLGKATLLLLVVNVLASVYQKRLRLKFETWRCFHDLLGPAVILLAFTHSWFVGDHLQSPVLKTLWIVLLVLGVSVFGYHRIVRPRRLRARAYRVTEVIPETEDVWTVKMSPPEGESIPDYAPGQFHFLTFYRKAELPVEEHHWTISSSPAQRDYVSSTIKALGDFTSTMGQTEKGDRVAVHGPFGRFSYAFHPEEKDLVFIAGGIGITPMMSMLRHMKDTRDSRAVTFLYANRKQSDMLFRRELAEIEEGEFPALKVVHVLSKPDEAWSGETGYIDKKKVERYCGTHPHEKTFYVCGPPGMLGAVLSTLRELGVPDARIRIEIFSFLD